MNDEKREYLTAKMRNLEAKMLINDALPVLVIARRRDANGWAVELFEVSPDFSRRQLREYLQKALDLVPE